MTTFIIETENSITALGNQQADFEGEIFASQQELADLAAKWPANRLIEIWNGIPGLTPVKKFTDRKSAVSRIWKAIQSLDGGGATEGATTATAATERASKRKAGGKEGQEGEARHEARGQGCQRETRQRWRQARRSARRQQEGRGSGSAPAQGRRNSRPDYEGNRLVLSASDTDERNRRMRVLMFVRSYTLAFFDKHVRGIKAPLLDRSAPDQLIESIERLVPPSGRIDNSTACGCRFDPDIGTRHPGSIDLIVA
jgi:hypothetical protein